MSIKLHRCRFTFVHSDMSQCYKGSRRKDVERLSGQRLLPVIEFEDGSVYRDAAAASRSMRSTPERAPALRTSPAPAPPGESSPH